MKKNYFYAAMAGFGLLAFSSCSSDDNSLVGPNPEELTGEQVIVLDMQDTDVLSTKSRPLLSTTNQGAEKVTDLKLYIFKVTKDKQTGLETQTMIREIDVPNWDQVAKDYNYGRKYSIRLTGENKLDLKAKEKDLKQITILAVGQDEKSVAPAPFKWGNTPVSIPGLDLLTDANKETNAPTWVTSSVAGTGFKELFTNAVGKDKFERVSEIFSGTSETTPINLDGGFEAKVLLKRQVAGVLGYFDHIPATVKNAEGNADLNIRYIRLVASQRNTQLDLTTNLAAQEDDATETDAKEADIIVSGFSGADNLAKQDAKYVGTQGADDAFTVYTIDLAKWFKGWNATQKEWDAASKDSDNLLKTDAWTNGLDVADKLATVLPGAVLAGEFVIPFNRVDGSNTFELQLLTADYIVAKAWNVKLDEASRNPEEGDGELVYNIYRNHLYQIGQRGSGDNPQKPGEGDDKPQPLNKDQDLVIKINDQWEFIHDMEIE